MRIDMNREIRGLVNKIHSRDPGAKVNTIVADPKKPVRFNIPDLAPFSKHMFDLTVEMTDKIKHPKLYYYAVLNSAFGGLQIIAYNKV